MGLATSISAKVERPCMLGYIDLRSVRSVKRIRRRAMSQARERQSGAWHLILETPSREWDLFPEPMKIDLGKGGKERRDHSGIGKQNGSGKRFRMKTGATGTSGHPASITPRPGEEARLKVSGGEGQANVIEREGKELSNGGALTNGPPTSLPSSSAATGEAVAQQQPTASELREAQGHRSMVWYSALFKELMEFLVNEDRMERSGTVTNSKAAAIFSTKSERAAAHREEVSHAKGRSFGKGTGYASHQVQDYDAAIGKAAGI